MSIKNDSQLSIDVATFLPDNTTEEISAQDERERFIDVIDSKLSIVDGGTVMQDHAGLATYSPPTLDGQWAPKKYVDDLISGEDDGSIKIKGGFQYWKGVPDSPVTGDIREGMVGTDLQLQEFDNPDAPGVWSVRSSR